jgi:hypothetical protein
LAGAVAVAGPVLAVASSSLLFFAAACFMATEATGLISFGVWTVLGCGAAGACLGV